MTAANRFEYSKNLYQPNVFLIIVQGCNDVGCGQESPEATIFSAEDVPQVAPNQVSLNSHLIKILSIATNSISLGCRSCFQLYIFERDLVTYGSFSQANARQDDWLPYQVLAPTGQGRCFRLLS